MPQKNFKDLRVSIVIPIYNSDKYLDRCIKSVINQTYKNIEIILINDGSTDNSEEICKHYASKNNNVIYIHNNINRGTVVSRKEGIKKSSGDFIMFVDSDDYILPYSVERLINISMSFPYDLIVFNMCYTRDDCSFSRVKLKEFSGEINEFYKNIQMLYNPGHFDPVCNKFYNAKKLKHCISSVDDNILMGEDLLFNIAFLEECKHLKIVSDVFYVYNKSNPNSVTTMFSSSLYEEEFLVLDVLVKFLMDKCKDVEDCKLFVLNDIKNRLFYLINMYIKSTNLSLQEKFIYLRDIIERYKNSELFCEEVFKSDFQKEVLYLIQHDQYAGIYYLKNN